MNNSSNSKSNIDWKDAIKAVYQAYPIMLDRKIQQIENVMLDAEYNNDLLLWLSLADKRREYKSYKQS